MDPVLLVTISLAVDFRSPLIFPKALPTLMEIQLGAVEDAVRREVEGNSAIAELAYKLAHEIDIDSGGVAAIRELRAVLNAYKASRPFRQSSSRLTVVPESEHDDELDDPTRGYVEGGTWINGKKVR
jgi:hypothetical protein